MSRYAPTETKVTRAGITAAVVTLALYALGFVPFVAAMPDVVYGAVVVLVTGAATYAVAWAAPHTPRPEDAEDAFMAGYASGLDYAEKNGAQEPTVEIGGQVMTEAQYDAARRPLLDHDIPETE